MRLILGDCFEELKKLDDESIDSVCTDPPYGINFMGEAWDGKAIEDEAAKPWNAEGHMRLTGSPDSANRKLIHRSGSAYRNRAGAAGKYDLTPKGNYAFQEWTRQWAEEAFRLLKPGGYLLSFSSTRTYHRMVCGIEDAGFEIRDTLMWVQGQGFPKSLNLEGGLGTALKPSFEPIVMARKPLVGTVAGNVAKYGTGAMNIDATRIGESKRIPASPSQTDGAIYGALGVGDGRLGTGFDPDVGRWPSNLLLSHLPECELVSTKTVEGRTIRRPVEKMLPFGGGAGKEYATIEFPDEVVEVWDCVDGCPVLDMDEAARYFYQPKVSVSERHAGTETTNQHPTVKPIDLMRWLCRLVTPRTGVVLDPFLGSGTTAIAALLEGFDFVGIEREENYMEIARARLAFWETHGEDGLRIIAERDAKLRPHKEREKELAEMGQMNMLDLL